MKKIYLSVLVCCLVFINAFAQCPTLTSGINSNNQTVCKNSPITPITYSVSGFNQLYTNFSPSLPTGIDTSTNWGFAGGESDSLQISGIPSVAGVYTYTISSVNCGNVLTGTITVNSCVTTCSLTSAAGTDNQSICSTNTITGTNPYITPITYAVSNYSVSVTGLPAFASYDQSTQTISSNSSIHFSNYHGIYTYTLTSIVENCSATGTISIGLNMVSGTTSQTVCANQAINTIVAKGSPGVPYDVQFFDHSYNPITIPAGLDTASSFNGVNDSVKLFGTPTLPGIYNFLIKNNKSQCYNDTIWGDITVNNCSPTCTLSLMSAAGTDTQTVCLYSPITAITYSVNPSTSAVTGLPSGVTYDPNASPWPTISGNPTQSGVFTYTLTNGSCASTGTLTVNNCASPCQIDLTSAIGTDTQTVCINFPIAAISYSVTGAVSATVTGLPNGISFNSGTGVISGSPTVSGTFNYSVSSTGTCSAVQRFGQITVGSVYPVISGNSPTICTGKTATLTASGANTYIWSTGETTSSISKSPTTTTNYTVIGTTNGCKDTITQHIAVNSLTVIAGNSPTICSGQTATLTVSGTSSYVWSTGETTSSIIKAPTTTTTYSVTGTDALTGCSKTTTDFITVYNCSSPCQISLSSSLGTDTQTVCVNSPITSISYSVTGAASAMVAGLPNGITFNSGTGVISGSPTVSGTFNYSVSSTGTCNVAQKYGKITIDTLPIAYTGNGSDTICENASVTLGGLNSAANGAILWTENGAGNITSGATTLSPTYTSAAADAGNTLILTMTVTSTNSCAPQTATATYSVTVNPVPTATIIGTTYDLQNNILPKLIFMGMRGVTPYTFSYSINGGTTQTLSTITGDTVSINVPVTAATSYTYSLLQVQDNNGCNQTNPALSDSVIFTINPPTSINGINESITAAAFPNPFSNQLRVVVEEKSSVKITDVMGKQVYSDIFESGSNTIETANLNSGLYFITITNNMGAVTKKVIKN